MKSKRYTDKEIQEVLCDSAEISHYFIYQPNDLSSALIHYCSADGKQWAFLEDDNDFALACVKYLLQQNVPVFSDISQLDQYAETLSANIKNTK